MKPESEIASAFIVVGYPGQDDHAEPEPYRYLAPHFPVELGRAEDPWYQVHGHEPQRDRNDRNDEWKPVDPQRDDPRDDRGDLHENPAALDPDIEVSHRARL